MADARPPLMRAIEYGRIAATPALKQRLRDLYAGLVESQCTPP